MRLKTLSAILILLLTLIPTYAVPSEALAKFAAKFDDSVRADLVANNDSVTGVQVAKDLKMKSWDFENTNEWSKYVCMNNDSIELVLGVGNADQGTIGKLKNTIDKFYGKIVNNVWIKGVLDSIVIDLPLQSVSSFVNEIQDSGMIGYIEPNMKYQIHSTPNDPFWNLQWGPQKIGADWAWNTTIGKRDILVAVVDTGIEWNHTDLAANYVPLGYDWVNNDTDPMDDNGHGTHCAGIIAAVTNNSVGIAGIAQVRIMAEKGIDSSGSGNEDDLANAIVHAVEQNATIISMSWGSYADSTLIHEAIKFAYDSGVLLIASAGNAASDYKSYPAAYDEVVAVSATDQTDRPAYFSNFGDWIELAAPGVQIYSTVLNNGYGYKSGTSMAAPHVAGVAALVWSIFPNMTRDQVRHHLQYTADDLGAHGFDKYYGYGRINATRAVNQLLPENELVIENLQYPSYIELNSSGILNATILNYGARDESNITVEFLSNGTFVSSDTISFLKTGLTAYVNFTWTPPAEGLYNITINMLPVPNETVVENNFIKVNIYGGTPIKAYVVRSSGTYFTWTTATWEKLNKRWFEFGNTSVFIDFTTLDKGNITYQDLAKSGADVLIISSAYSQDFGWEFSDSEIKAITEYVYEGHGLIVTADTFSFDVPNNNKFARILGMDETASWSTNMTSSLNILKPENPIFRNISTPYNLSLTKLTTTPNEGWTQDALAGAEYVALGNFNESAIVTYKGILYSSVAIEAYASENDLQLFYNIIAWSHYERPQHDLISGLETPRFALPGSSVQLNATVSNIGTSSETNVELLMIINGSIADSITIPELTSDLTYTMNYLWTDLQRGTFNVTAYVSPVANETNLLNNKITRFVTVSDPIIHPIEGQWANYTLNTVAGNISITDLINFTYDHYVSPYEINVTYLHSSYGYESVASSIVNTITRQAEKGTWEGSWFPGWIETTIALGSKLNVLNGVGTVVDSKNIIVNNQTFECWNVFVNFPYENYTFYYDKFSGLLTGYDRESIFFQEELTLLSTNIPLGRLIQPKIRDYVVYGISYFNNNDVTAYGTITFSYAEFIDVRRVRVQIVYMLFDRDNQLIENFTGSILVNIQTRIIEEGPAGLNGNYYFGWIETNINPGSSVKICNQTGIVAGNAIYSVGQRVFDTWLVYVADETQLCFYDYDKASGLLIKMTKTSLNDPSQNVTLMLFQTNVDVTPPNISIKNPTNNKFINSTEIEMQWVGSDNETGIDHYVIYLDSVDVAYVGNSFSTYLLTQIADGTHTIKVEAYDMAGNVNGTEVTIVVDVTPPVAHIVTPNNGSYIKGTVEIKLSGNDTWFDSMQLSINDAFKAMYLSQGNQTYSWDTSAYNDGIYNILLEAVDKAGNTAIDQIAVIVDNTIPEVRILQNEEYARDVSKIVVDAHETNLDNASLYVNSQLIDTWSSAGVHTTLWNTTTFLDGTYTLKAKAFDKAGNSVEQSLQVTVDNTPPTIKIISPKNGTYVSGNVRINLTAIDDNLESATLILDGETLADATASTYYEWNTGQITDGQHILRLEAIDKAGNGAIDQITIIVDNAILEVQIPQSGEYMRGVGQVVVYTNGANLDNVSLYVNSQLIDTWSSVGVHTTLWNTTTFLDGTYTLKAKAFDKAGNLQTESVAVTVDNTRPVVSIFSPMDNAVVSANISITFVAVDRNLKAAVLFLNQTSYDVTNATELTIDTKILQDGTYELRLTALDCAGNQNEAAIAIAVDNTNPTVAISAPADGAQLLGIIDINFTASDEHLATVFLQIDAAVINVTMQTHFQWNTTNVGDGTHTIEILAVDSAGNTAESQTRVWTRNVQRATEDSYNAGRNLGILAGALLAITVIAVAIAVKYLPSHSFSRKSKRKEITKLTKDLQENNLS